MRNIRSILMPVDFSGNAATTLAKAVGIFPPDHVLTIHLFHVKAAGICRQIRSFINNPGRYDHIHGNADIHAARKHLEQLKILLGQQQPLWKILTWVGLGGPVQDSIILKAKQLDVDLIVIGKNYRHRFFPFFNTITPVKLSLLSRKPVLTVKPGTVNAAIRSVVIPLDSEFPQSKLNMLEKFVFHSVITIRLVTFEDKAGSSPAGRQLIFDTFRALKTRPGYKVTYESLAGKNKAKALLNYCEQVDADMLILYLNSGIGNNYWLDSRNSDLIHNNIRTQVLSLSPAVV